jgi:hypothetical protein
VRPALLGLVAGRLVDPGVSVVIEPVVPPAAELEPVAPAGPPVVPGSDPGAPRFERVRSLGVPLRFESLAPELPLRSLGVAPPWSPIVVGCCPGWEPEPNGMPVPSRGAVPRAGSVDGVCCATPGAASVAATADAITRWEKRFM